MKVPNAPVVLPPGYGAGHFFRVPLFKLATPVDKNDQLFFDGTEVEGTARHFRDDAIMSKELRIIPTTLHGRI